MSLKYIDPCDYRVMRVGEEIEGNVVVCGQEIEGETIVCNQKIFDPQTTDYTQPC